MTIRARLLLLALSVLAAAVLTTVWLVGQAGPRTLPGGSGPAAAWQVGLAALLLLGLTVLASSWVARGIAAPVRSLQRAAADLQAGRPVQPRPSGIVECDELARTLAHAAGALRAARAELEQRRTEAAERGRADALCASQCQRADTLGRLTSGVVHDFKNLLGVISNSAHLLQRHAGGHPALEVPVAATLRAVDLGSRLTQLLLRVAGQQPAPAGALDLGQALPELHDLLQTLMGPRFELVVSVAPGTRRITADPGELELALLNLALNARDASAGGGRIGLRARDAGPHELQGLAPGGYVVLAVTDDGSGVDEHLAERVFEPFFTTKPPGLGTGLGLSQVRGFCVRAGGAVRLASAPGRGTTVSLLLPASPEPERADPPAAWTAAALPGVAP